MTNTLAMWLTDSSMIEWRDTAKLDVSFPRWRWPQVVAESLGAEIDEHYEGRVDPMVAIGGRHLPWREGGMDGEAEWAALFAKPLVQYDEIAPETPCILQGMIEGKWIAHLAQEGEVDWAPATIGNNLLARGRGIQTTLGGISHGDDGISRATVMVNFPMASGENQVHHAYGADLAKLPILPIVQAVWRWCRENPEQGGAVQAVNFGANGEMSAYATDPSRQHKNLRAAFLPRFFRQLMHLCPKDTFHVINEVRSMMFQEIVERGEYVRPGATMLLTVTDGRGYLVGEGAMLLSDPEEEATPPELPAEAKPG